MSLHTPLCDLLGIDYPILSVGFGIAAPPELAAAVSNAGGLGVMGSSGDTSQRVRDRIAMTRQLADRPFGANVLLMNQGDPEIEPKLERRIMLLIEERVPVIVFFWGDPSPYVKEAHNNGVKVLVQVGSVEEGERAAAAGADAVIAQGSEAGGHVRSVTPIWEILPTTVEVLAPLPVLASGGIGDGTGIAKALGLGAQGVSMGTRFVASEEAWVHPDYKDRVVMSSAEDTLRVEDLFNIGWPEAPHRVIRNRVVEEWEAKGRPGPGDRPGEGTDIGTWRPPWGGDEHPWPRYAVGMVPPTFTGDVEDTPMWAGTSVGEVSEIKPAGEIVRDLVREAEAALAASSD